ncbi:MAG: SMP-30/gluconolactonase/LRE family protein [Cyclobacteriaceae bacterium]
MSKEFKTIGSIEILNDQLQEVINTNAKIEILATGFSWSEGPVWLPKEQKLLFSDVPKNTVYSWSETDSITTYLNPSGYTGSESWREGSNGLILNKENELVLCQHGNRQLAKMNSTLGNPKVDFTSLADNYEGKKFNSPNDVVQHSNGTYFFTDPPYGLTEDDTKELDFQGVYKLEGDDVTLLIDSLTRPNGIALSPDQKTLYVAQSDPKAARYYTYSLDENNNIIDGKILLDVTPLLENKENKGLPDGLKVDENGNIFATGPGGVLILNPQGVHLGTIRTERATANCAFNEDKTVLFMTAHEHLMRIVFK